MRYSHAVLLSSYIAKGILTTERNNKTQMKCGKMHEMPLYIIHSVCYNAKLNETVYKE
jgi:hypothetical protein